MDTRLPSLEPFGRALLDYQRGKSGATLQVRHSLDGLCELSVEIFFRPESDFFDFEQAALAQCRGSVLDIGAGTGIHSLFLQERGFPVTAVEVVPQAVEVMRERGIREVLEGDVMSLDLPPADTVILLMNGTGLAGTLAGMKRLFTKLHRVVAMGGQILIDSTDPDQSPAAGVYPGEARIELAYQGEWGEPYGELYCDHKTLSRIARATGWHSQLIFLESDGTFLARLE